MLFPLHIAVHAGKNFLVFRRRNKKGAAPIRPGRRLKGNEDEGGEDRFIGRKPEDSGNEEGEREANRKRRRS